jgi:hypothetical protein
MIFEAFKVTDNPEDQRVILEGGDQEIADMPDEGEGIERGSAKARLGGLY